MNDPMTSKKRRQHLHVVTQKELTILHRWLWQWHCTSKHLSSWNWKWLSMAKREPWASLKLFPQWRESLCQSPWGQEGVAAWLTAFLGQGCPTVPATWVQLWARHCRWKKDNIDAAPHRAAPGQGSGALQAALVHDSLISTTPSGPRVAAVTQVQGKGSVRPWGGALKNAAPVRKWRCDWKCTLNSHSKSVTGLYSNHRTKALGISLFTNFTSYANDFFDSILKFAVLFVGKILVLRSYCVWGTMLPCYGIL